MPMTSDSPLPDNDPDQDDDDTVEDIALGPADMSESARVGNVVQLLPVHAAPTVGGKGKQGHTYKVTRTAGRPRRVERMPTTSDLEYHALMTEERGRFVDTDPVVRATQKNADPLDVLKIIKGEVAKESAALHFQRIENEKYGRDVAQVSTRRIDALKKIADIELEIKKLGADTLDIHSEKFQRVFKFWINTIREIAEQTMTPEQIDLFFNHLSTSMEGWEEKVAATLR